MSAATYSTVLEPRFLAIYMMFTYLIHRNKKYPRRTFTFISGDDIIYKHEKIYTRPARELFAGRKGITAMKTRGTKALVTGGSRGIGFGIARRLTLDGVKVVITGRNEKTLREAAERIGADYIVWDIADTDVMRENFDRAKEMLGGLDILVSNAGVLTPAHEWGMSMLELTPEEWDNVMNVNLRGAYFMMQTAVRHMYENKIRGNVLNIASVAATEPFYGPYCTSKAGVVGLTRGWGKQFAPYGIVINGIGPGPVATEMNGWHEGDPMDHSRIPTGRYLTVEEVSSLAMYMLSDEATQMVGETVMIDGGYDIK